MAPKITLAFLSTNKVGSSGLERFPLKPVLLACRARRPFRIYAFKRDFITQRTIKPALRMFQAMSANMKKIFMRMDFLVNLSIFVFPFFAQEASCNQKKQMKDRGDPRTYLDNLSNYISIIIDS